ncbi:cupin domain-containing protein [Streptomyces rhizosphaerihabitans]|uniref:cupin domain-containing protein n=1 Tax=Streptomyces rhizosphaerihabitans TaxID=1266770 RepID=UPI0021BF9526|nr:cupin domain-containing protein [Streptomyces rhizosphaerihabitans]MCT9008667.1 cupin domain-containing protein [Streptomyces rhizosphaerihabitans]
MRALLRTGSAGIAALCLSLVAVPAHATPPGPGVSGRTIAQTTVDGTDYILREITIPAGQATGWHYHDGPLYGYVKQGTLSHFDSTCAKDGLYRAGDSLTEPSGPTNVHIGRNLGTKPLVLDVLYVLPHGAPFSEDSPNPGCAFE